MKAYITKYALAKGILEKDGIVDHAFPQMLVVKGEGINYSTYYHKNEWFADLEEARKNARSRRDKKIASLEKQLQKLEKMEF